MSIFKIFYRNLVVEENEFRKVLFGQAELLLREVVVGELDKGDVRLLELVVHNFENLRHNWKGETDYTNCVHFYFGEYFDQKFLNIYNLVIKY